MNFCIAWAISPDHFHQRLSSLALSLIPSSILHWPYSFLGQSGLGFHVNVDASEISVGREVELDMESGPVISEVEDMLSLKEAFRLSTWCADGMLC